MFYLRRYDAEPLVQGQFQAWHFGPVHPDLYHAVKMYGACPARTVPHAQEIDVDSSEVLLLGMLVSVS